MPVMMGKVEILHLPVVYCHCHILARWVSYFIGHRDRVDMKRVGNETWLMRWAAFLIRRHAARRAAMLNAARSGWRGRQPGVDIDVARHLGRLRPGTLSRR